MNLNYIAPINRLGYGVTGLNILKELVNANVKVALFPIGNIEVDIEYKDLLEECLSRRSFFVHDAPCLKVFHQNQMAKMVGRGKHIGFPIFELETLTEEEKHHLCTLDKIIVTSQWAKNVLIKELQEKKIELIKQRLNRCITHIPVDIDGIVNQEIDTYITIAPLGVDTSIFHPFKSTIKRDDKKCIFLNVGKWEVRKGHDILIESFHSAFPNGNEEVELWMLCNNPFLSQQQTLEWELLYRTDKRIKFIPRLGNAKDVANLMNAVDFGVFPSRAEGWNLEALEMMACGKHSIISDCTAHTEFCDLDNSFLIPHTKEYELAYDGVWFKNQGSWMKINQQFIDRLALRLSYCYKAKLSGGFLFNSSGIETAKRFSWKHTVESIISILD